MFLSVGACRARRTLGSLVKWFILWEIDMRSAICWVRSRVCIVMAILACSSNANAGVIVDISEVVGGCCRKCFGFDSSVG